MVMKRYVHLDGDVFVFDVMKGEYIKGDLCVDWDDDMSYLDVFR